jgi:hypothetical protein
MKPQLDTPLTSNRNPLRWLWFTLFLISLASSGKASHGFGTDIIYTCINPCTTRVSLRMYNDCSASCYWGLWFRLKERTPGCVLPPIVGPVVAALTTELTPICPSVASNCSMLGSQIKGLDEWTWSRDYDICAGSPCEFDILWTDCCRSPMLQNLVNPGSTGYAIVGTFISTGLGSCNNSPVFTDPPVSYFCSGQDQQFALGAYDPDGDSLAYTLMTCYADSVNTVNYAVGYSALQPMGPTWNLSLDSLTGILTMQALPGNNVTAAVAVRVDEYRNGLLIGSIQRDMQFIASACGANVAPSWPGNTNVTGATAVVGNVIYRCSPGTICVDIPSADLNASQNLTMTWDQHLAGATFVDATNIGIQNTILGTGANPPVGRLCFTPPSNGLYTCRIKVQDDNCPYYGYADKVIAFMIGPVFGGSTATGNLTCVMSGYSATFSANGCGPGPFTYTWSGLGGFAATGQNATHTYGSPGVYPWQVIITDGATVHDTIRDTITVLGQIPYQSLITGNLGLDSCAGIFTNTLSAGPNVNFLWNNGATTANITVTSPGLYAVTVTDPNGCLFQDTTTVGVHRVDISGIVRTSLGTYLQNQKVYLIKHDTAQQALIALDSVITDAFGYYQFCNVVDTLVFLKAAPDSMAYPLEMPTYASLSLFWSGAITIYPLTQLPLVHNFSTLSGVNPGGPGFIGGLITQGANKMNAVGDPVVGLRVFLRNSNSGAILGYRDTDVNGYFSFGNIPLDDYEIVPDKPLVSTTNVPALTITAQTPVLDSLDFQLHRTWLELALQPNGLPSATSNFAFAAQPNPFGSSTMLHLELPEDAQVHVQVVDALGKFVKSIASGALKKGAHRFEIGSELQAGVYFVRLSLNGNSQTIKVLKAE